MGLGGLVDYQSADPVQSAAYKFQNPEGFYTPGAHPDNVGNEEYYGMVTANRQPKAVFQQLAEAYTEHEFIRADADCNGQVDVTDAIYTLGYLFQEKAAPVCQDSADANDDGVVDLSDAVKTLLGLFSGAPIAAPYPQKGQDPTLDTLPCAVSCPHNP